MSAQSSVYNGGVGNYAAASGNLSESQQFNRVVPQSPYGDSSKTTKAKQHFKGCNCRKTRCQKNYCECYQAGVPCSTLCTCDGCQNGEGKHNHPPKRFGPGIQQQNMYSNNVENMKGSENFVNNGSSNN